MNPAIVIPTYWTSHEMRVGVYDHATPVDAESPDLERCLQSLEQVRGVMRTIILLVAPPDTQKEARDRVREICSRHRKLAPLVIGDREARPIIDAISVMAPTMPGECISLRGYGAIRNMGLLVSALLSHDVVVYLDDDEVVLSEDFLVDGVYGLGSLTRSNLPLLAKSGYFLDANDSPLAPEGKLPWYDRDWNKNAEFNAWMRQALNQTRISRSNHVCGGCMAVHAEAYTKVAFDPFITRGEDLDYLINLRFFGYDVWFDNQWYVKHLPPETPVPSNRFRQDVFRWIYEREKINYASGRIGFNHITADSLMPYPGLWMSDAIDDRIANTALRRSVGTSEHGAYFDIWRRGRHEAMANAKTLLRSYLQFQSWWPTLISRLWNSTELADQILGAGRIGLEEKADEGRPARVEGQTPSE